MTKNIVFMPRLVTCMHSSKISLLQQNTTVTYEK